MSRKLCWIIATIFLFNVGCERKKDIGRVSSATNMFVGSDTPSVPTDNEMSVANAIIDMGKVVDGLTGGNVGIVEGVIGMSNKHSPAKTISIPDLRNWLSNFRIKYWNMLSELGTLSVTGFLSWAGKTGYSDWANAVNIDNNSYIRELREIKADPDGWFNEAIGDGYAVLSRVTRIDGAYARSLEDLVKVRQNTPSAQAVIKRIEIKVISGGAIEQYTGITDPGSKTPSVLHTISYNDREVLSAGFTYNVDMKIWSGATITKKTSVGATATCTPSSNGVDWVLEGAGWRQQWKFSYESTGQTWSGFYAVKLWDPNTGEVLLDLKNEQSGKGLLTVISLFTAGGVLGENGTVVY